MSNGGIFINYRRCDGTGSPREHALFVEILSHELAEHFGDSNVFIDTSECAINGSPAKLSTKLTVLNGNHHHTGRSERRPEVIPVLLEKTDPPKLCELPEDIKELAVLQAFRLRFGSLTNGLTQLFAELEIHTSPSWPLSPAPDPQTPNNRLERTGRNMPGRLASRSRVRFGCRCIRAVQRKSTNRAVGVGVAAWTGSAKNIQDQWSCR